MYSVTKKYNYIIIVTNVEIPLPKLFKILPKFLTNKKTFGCALTHLHPSSYTIEKPYLF